ncbi:dTDP-glucose 4,6-dehydratase [Halobellus limi]|uniref:NAD-dependent epimerase/dehydratase family protein n=1 Tax=Halobellus limi TaxID=699433 RepID=A0A1H5UU90_9EURY|nr:GDP-mannose 4,6-dehydratase [Halobellus limi]QCC46944.1 NAD-dependent epimerase/dehydratase family protein [Halobellus limi]SEF77777.1 Nucleoside-diphosphate-sugar epimerase [Halobellus limi]
MSETVVVTGAAGFIGRWVVNELLDRGYIVRGIDNLSNGANRNIKPFRDHDRFEFREGDVRDEQIVSDLFENDPNACIHLAAEIDVQESLEDPQAHFETNVVGTKNVLEACRRTDTRLGLVGTCMVYDVADSDEGIDEEHPVKPASPYAGSKLAAENLAESYYHGYDLPVVTLRPFNTYGPYQKTGMAGGVVSIFTNRDIAGEPLKIFGDGTQSRDLLYATDCARFIVEGTFCDDAIGEVLNAGTGSDISINDLAELIATEGTEITHVEHHHPQSEVQTLRCDPSKAGEMLDWEPEVSLEEGVDRLRTWLREERFD